jgi:hypothetical protein
MSRARLVRALRVLTLCVIVGSVEVAAADQPLATYTLSPGWATFGLAPKPCRSARCRRRPT